MIRTLTIVFVFLGAVFSIQAQKMLSYEICSTELLKPQDIDTLSVDQLAFLSNEIYARNGYKFSNEKYNEYFSYKLWYKSLGDNSQVKLSTIEEQNVKLLVDRRKEREQERVVILDYFKRMQQQAIKGDKVALEKNFSNVGLNKDLLENGASFDCLISVLKKIDFDDINWYKNNALHSVTVDNGYVKIMYSFAITSEGIALTYNYMAHSDIMEEFDTPFSDYMSESEYAVWWVFSYEDRKVVFQYINMAG